MTQCHFVRFKIRILFDYSISLSIPVILPSRILFLLNCFHSTVSHTGSEGYFIEFSVVRCICLAFYGSSERMYEPQVHKNLQNVPLSQMKTESLQICCSFKRIKGNSFRLKEPSSSPSLNRNQSEHSVSSFGSKNNCCSLLGVFCLFFLYFDARAVKRLWQCLPFLTNDTSDTVALHQRRQGAALLSSAVQRVWPHDMQ